MSKKLNLYLILIYFFSKISADYDIPISTPIPENGTFVFNYFSDRNCNNLVKTTGFLPKSKIWINAIENKNYSIESFDNSTRTLKFVDSNEIINCDNNECKYLGNDLYYRCNFIENYLKSKFEFKGFSDKHCNNLNDDDYTFYLGDYCWKLKGKGSIGVQSFYKRNIGAYLFENDNCMGTYKKIDFECNEKCFKNIIGNNEKIYYTCKFSKGKYFFINKIILFGFLLIL